MIRDGPLQLGDFHKFLLRGKKCVLSQRKSRCLFVFVDHGQAVVNSGRPGCFAVGLVYFMVRLVRSPSPGPKASGSEHSPDVCLSM